MTRKRTLAAGDSAPLNRTGHGGTHSKSVPASAIWRLHKSGLTERKIAKKLGCSLQDVHNVVDPDA